jgi:hypothetical protein
MHMLMIDQLGLTNQKQCNALPIHIGLLTFPSLSKVLNSPVALVGNTYERLPFQILYSTIYVHRALTVNGPTPAYGIKDGDIDVSSRKLFQ